MSRQRVPTTVWRIRPAVVLALAEHLGEPVDSYVNGSQVWLVDDGDLTLEWRLHPVASYESPSELSTYELWENVVAALGGGQDADALALGDERRALDSIWDGLECFPAFEDQGDVEPGVLGRRTSELLGIPPDKQGLVDHERIGTAWERARGEVSIVELLLEQL